VTGIALVVVLAAGLSGCVPSVYPLYTDKDIRFDTALLGTWAEEPEKDTWTFAKRDDTSYTLLVKDEDESALFEVHLLQLGKYRFLDFAPDDDALKDTKLMDIYKAALIPGHLFFKINAIEPVLKMQLLDAEWLEHYLDAHPKDLAYRRQDRHSVVLLSPTRDLQPFVLKHAEDKGAFGDESEMKKIAR
jgi:hypothetical protein